MKTLSPPLTRSRPGGHNHRIAASTSSAKRGGRRPRLWRAGDSATSSPGDDDDLGVAAWGEARLAAIGKVGGLAGPAAMAMAGCSV